MILLSKYDNYELENILRNKLYQKGYDLNEIKKNIDWYSFIVL